MQCVMHQEAGRAFGALEEHLEAIAIEVAPLVESVTGLPLPDPVIIRTMTVRRWKSANWRAAKRRFHTEAQQLQTAGIAVRQLRVAAVQLRNARKFRRHNWPQVLAQAVAFEPGHPEVVIMPEALRHAGRLEDTPVLYKALGHELTHLAQYAASKGAVWAAQDSFFPGLRGIEDRDYHFLVEGHAYWADQQITSKVFGKSVSTDEVSPEASARYRQLVATPEIRALREHLRRAAENVAEIIDTNGLNAFNRVWNCPDLVPLRSEVDAPELWRRRFA